MQNWLWKIFPPYEVRLTKQVAKAFFKEAGSARLLESEVMAIIGNAEKTVYAVRIDRMKPDEVAFFVIADALVRHIGSGRYHTYRGLLSMVGNDMLKSFNAVQKLRVQRGYCAEAAVEDDARWLRERIKEVG